MIILENSYKIQGDYKNSTKKNVDVHANFIVKSLTKISDLKILHFKAQSPRLKIKFY